jgi:hypothetical protein
VSRDDSGLKCREIHIANPSLPPQYLHRPSYKVWTPLRRLAVPLLPLHPLTGITSGGSGGAIYAYIFGWIGTVANFMVLAELASMYAA